MNLSKECGAGVPPPPAQFEAWLHDRLGPAAEHSTVCAAYLLSGTFADRVVVTAVNELYGSCASSRTDIRWSADGQPCVAVSPPTEVTVTWTDLRERSVSQWADALGRCRAAAVAGFERGDRGLRVQAARLADDRVVVWLSTRRWQVGAASAPALGRMLLERCAGVAGAPPTDAGSAAGGLDQPDRHPALAQVAAVDPGADDGAAGRRRSTAALDDSAVGALRALIERTGCTTAEALSAGLAVLLAHYGAAARVTLGRPAGTDEVGPDAGNTPASVDIAPQLTFERLIERLRQGLPEDGDAAPSVRRLHSGSVPRRPDDPLIDPLVEAAVCVRSRSGPLRRGGVSLHQLGVGSWHDELPLRLCLYIDGSHLELSIEYRADRFTTARTRQIREHLGVVWAAAAADPAVRVLGIPLLTPDERTKVLDEWQGARLPYARIPIDRRVSQIAAAFPDVAAGEFRGRRLSYAELDQRANALAHRLVALGAGRETVVAISMERCLEVLVAMVGVFRAGAAFVFVDPDAPPARSGYMLRETRASAVLTTSWVRDRLPGGAPVIDVDTFTGGEPTSPLPDTDGDSLAYVLYTSGSTGAPKGVMVEHGEVANFIRWLGGRSSGCDPATGFSATWRSSSTSRKGRSSPRCVRRHARDGGRHRADQPRYPRRSAATGTDRLPERDAGVAGPDPDRRISPPALPRRGR